MKRLLAALFAAALVLTAAPPATADTPRCVTNTEFRTADPGNLRSVIHRIFDTDGWLSNTGSDADYNYQARGYPMCPKSGYTTAWVIYRDYKGGNTVWRADQLWRN